jgi:hypothetical protein
MPSRTWRAARHTSSESLICTGGPTHLAVLSKMGVLEDLRQIQTHAGAMAWVDERGGEIFSLPAEFAGGDIEVRRRDLSRNLSLSQALSTRR